jgi:hypothetical protein
MDSKHSKTLAKSYKYPLILKARVREKNKGIRRK